MEKENGKVKMENGTPSPRPAGKISDFTELETWKFARALRRKAHAATNAFPSDEKYGLTSQMRRAATSTTANIAEGYGRCSYQENLQFCRQARGSLYELRDHLTTAPDAGYLSKDIFAELEAMPVSAIRPINGYIRATKESEAVDTRKAPE